MGTVSGARRLRVEADGGSRGNPGPAGYGAAVTDAGTGEVLIERAGGIGRATNNVAEYRGLIAGLEAAGELAPSDVEVRMDSKLVVEQMSGRWKVRHPDLIPLHARARRLAGALPAVRYQWIPRKLNTHADRLANEAMDAAARGTQWRPPSERDSPAGRPATWGAVVSAAGTVSTATRAFADRVDAAPGWSAPTDRPTTTLLLRHGETALSVQRRFSGRTDQPLTPTGHAQAEAAAARLAAAATVVDAVVTSPLRRARDTARVLAAALDVPVTVEDGFAETDFGGWDGLTFAEVRQRWPEEMAGWLADPDVPPPGGESFTTTAVRVRHARGRLLAAHPGRTVVVVSHVTPIKTLLRLALQAPPAALYRIHLDVSSLSVVDWYADGPAVVRLVNDTGHLPPAGAEQP